MTQIFLSYARADGADAVARLRIELTRSGFKIWQDIENMMGGQAWKDQLRAALRKVDVVVVLLTPSAVTSKYVAWEWEMAQLLEKPVIPLLVTACDVPNELARLHYHDLSDEQGYTIGLMSLVRDLNQLGQLTGDRAIAQSSPPSPQAGNRNISIGGNANNSQIVIGDGNNISQTNH